MSPERMMATAIQEQPLILLPVLLFVFFLMRGLAYTSHLLSINLWNSKRLQ